MSEEEDKARKKEELLKELAEDTGTEDIFKMFADLPAKQRAQLFKKIYSAPLPSTQTYFKQKYALQLMEDIKAMLTDEELVLFYPYKDYHLAPKSVYMYVNDGFRYAVEFFDQDNKLKELRDKIEIARGKDGVYIRYKTITKLHTFKAVRLRASDLKESFLDDLPSPTVTVETKKQEDQVKYPNNEVFSFMENAKVGDKLVKTNLNLDADEIISMSNMFETDENFGLVWAKDRKSFTIRRLK